MGLSEIMPVTTAGTQFLKAADNLLDLLIQLHVTTTLVLIGATISILIKICGIANDVFPL